jgi:hypothetical protein
MGDRSSLSGSSVAAEVQCLGKNRRSSIQKSREPDMRVLSATVAAATAARTETVTRRGNSGIPTQPGVPQVAVPSRACYCRRFLPAPAPWATITVRSGAHAGPLCSLCALLRALSSRCTHCCPATLDRVCSASVRRTFASRNARKQYVVRSTPRRPPPSPPQA